MGSSESTCCNFCGKSVPYEPIEQVIIHSRHKQSRANDANNSKTYSEVEISGDNPSERLLSHDTTDPMQNNYCTGNITTEPQSNQLDQNKRRLTRPLFIMDFEIFKFDTNKCFSNLIDHEQNENNINGIIIDECDAVKRFMSALQYYSSFNLPNNVLSHNVLTSFCTNIYKNILNDYIHIMSNHSNQCKLLKKMVGKCTLSNCSYSIQNQKHRKQNGLFVFYRDLFDCVHNVLFHDDNEQYIGEFKRFIHPNDIMESYGQLQEIKNCENGQCIDQIFCGNLKEIVEVYVNMNGMQMLDNDNGLKNGKYKNNNLDNSLKIKHAVLVIGYIRSMSKNNHAMIGAVNILILNYYTQ